MDKKITYYIVAAVVLVAVIGIIIAMQNSGTTPPVPVGGGVKETPKTETKTETDAAKDIAQKMNLNEGQIPLRVTLDDNNQSASLTPGKVLVLMLGTDYDWKIEASDADVLAKREVTAADSRIQAVYQLAKEGKAVLTAAGTCKAKAKCASPTASFKFNVESVVSEVVSPEDLVK